MRTEYRLWHWADENAPAETLGQHPSEDEAMDAAGHPDPGDWHPTPDRSGHHLKDATGRTWVTEQVQVPESDADRVAVGLDLALSGGGCDGPRHKQWYLDQIVRALAGDRYGALTGEYCDGEDGPDTYSWDEGIAP